MNRDHVWALILGLMALAMIYGIINGAENHTFTPFFEGLK